MAEDVPKPPIHVQVFDGIVIPPLKIRKTSRSSIQLAELPPTYVLNTVTRGSISCAEKQSGLMSECSLIDDETKLPVNSTVTPDGDNDKPEHQEEKVTLLPYDYALADLTRYHSPQHLLAPIIQVQPATPTTPLTPLTTTPLSTPTIRIVNPFLQVPDRIHHGSLRRKW
jgi:hypothetical protein